MEAAEKEARTAVAEALRRVRGSLCHQPSRTMPWYVDRPHGADLTIQWYNFGDEINVDLGVYTAARTSD